VLKFPGKTVKVCPDAFAKAHSRGHTYYDRLVRQLKDGAVSGDTDKFSKNYSIKPSDVKKIMKENTFGLKLSTSQFTAATLPNTLLALFTASWMTSFFELTGNTHAHPLTCTSTYIHTYIHMHTPTHCKCFDL
jgi:hypothetical protein